MTLAGTVPPVPAGAVPLSILVDFDGTVAGTDVADAVLSRHATDPDWRDKDDAYVAGRAGSRTLLAWDATILAQDRAALEATAREQPLDETFASFVAWSRNAGAAVEVVSDGLGYYVEPALAALGVPDVPVATSVMDFSTRPFRLAFPFGHPSCFVCGTCKRERALAHRRAGRFVAFVGDGESDRYAAWHADLVFAKHRLVDVCEREGWSYVRWDRFADVGAWLRDALDGGRVPRTAAELAVIRGPDAAAAYICGPELWGPWRVDPGPGGSVERRG